MVTVNTPNSPDGPQRVAVELEPSTCGKRIRIRLENYDANLGWYPSASVTLPLHQLPILEQAIAEMRQQEWSCEIIPFPGIAEESNLPVQSSVPQA
jgi:hypothetical protein